MIVPFLASIFLLVFFLRLMDAQDYEYFIGNEETQARADSMDLWDVMPSDNERSIKNLPKPLELIRSTIDDSLTN